MIASEFKAEILIELTLFEEEFDGKMSAFVASPSGLSVCHSKPRKVRPQFIKSQYDFFILHTHSAEIQECLYLICYRFKQDLVRYLRAEDAW